VTVVDAHQHFWDPQRAAYPWLGPELAPINRAIGYDELAPILAATGIDRTVLVESADNAEDTRYMFEMAAAHPEIAAVVAWAPLEDPAATAAQLERLAGEPALVGVRTLIHNQPDPDWLLDRNVQDSLGLLADAGLSYDVVAVLPRHVEHVATIAERHPNLRLVIDHLAKPPINGGDPAPWRAVMARAAQLPTVYAKLSGLYPATGDQTRWSADDLRPYVDFALETFGPDRLMYGGDWPISVLFGGYAKVWGEIRVLLDELAAGERAAILGGTAIEFYRIRPERLGLTGSRP
jgi:L-fuconolactonase